MADINREKYKDYPDGLAKAMKEQKQTRDSQLEEILFDKQLKKFQEIKDRLPGREEKGVAEGYSQLSRQTAEPAERLNLSEAQIEQIDAIYAPREEEMRAMREQMQSGSVDRSQMKDKMEKMRAKMDEVNAKVEVLPDDEQKEKFSKYLEERQKENESRRPGKGGGGPRGR